MKIAVVGIRARWPASMTIYTMDAMTDSLHSLRAPVWLFARHEEIVGPRGRSADLKNFIDWVIENPPTALAADVVGPHDDVMRIRIEAGRKELFLAALPEISFSSALRRHMVWRIQHPDQPLPTMCRMLVGV